MSLRVSSFLAALALGAACLAPAVRAQDPAAEVAASYHDLAAREDHAGLVALFAEHPDLALVTIDADLEGSLRLRESSDEPDEGAIGDLQARALAGARAASEAAGHPIFLDYAAAFVGWDADQQRDFRAGQAAFGRSRQAASTGDHGAARQAGRECADLAEPLGDWWGTAMGLTAEGQALVALGEHEQGLMLLARARLIHHDLGLYGSEYGNLLGMIAALEALERTPRLREVLAQAIALGEGLGDAEGVASLRERRDQLEG